MASPDSITPAQRDVINELRRRTINDCSPKMLEDEYVFYRFSKARDYNVENAEAMIRKHIAWRKEFQIDTILTDFKAPEVLRKYGASNFLGFDKDGSVIRYVDLGKADAKGWLNSCKKVDAIKYSIQLVEQDILRLQKQSKKLGKPLTTFRVIYNFDKLTFAQATNRKSIEFLFMYTHIFQANYPERLKALYFINTSIYVTMTFSIIKPVMASSVLEKIKLFDSDGSKDALLQVIDADELPAFLGGNRTDPDGNPLCNSFIVHGQLVPLSYYLQLSKRTLHTIAGVKTKRITPFAKTEIHLEVKEPDSCLMWEFETKSRDIGFGVYYKEQSNRDEKPVELVTKQRVDTFYEPETGFYVCKIPGIYILLFDNTYSWIYGKEISYRTRIIGPNEKGDRKW